MATSWPGSFLLKMRWQTSGQARVIAEEFSALIRFLRESGSTFHSCTTLQANPVPRGIAFRYDVHARDLPGALLFANFHRQHGIPASFFLFWDYSRLERAFRSDFVKLNSTIASPLEVGLHDSPVDAYLLQRKFDGDIHGYNAWLPSEEAICWFRHLSENERELAETNTLIFRNFEARVRQTRELFGPVKTIAGHGGAIGQTWRPHIDRLGPEALVVRGFFAQNWLTPERVQAAGLESAVHPPSHPTPGWRQCSCTGGKIVNMARCIRRSLKEDSAVQLLIHAFTWTGATRDTDLSEALFAR